MNPIIRLTSPADSAGVVATVAEVYAEYGFTWDEGGYHADLYDLSEYCDPNQARFWVAELDGQIVGCGGVVWFPIIKGNLGELVRGEENLRVAGTSAEVARMYVRPAGRRLGIGSAIMNLILHESKLRDVDAIEIWSDKLFLDAHRLYEKFGAIKCGERICNDPDQAPEWGYYLPVCAENLSEDR
jgi:GNAT superfamily N-acetyltransferase